MVDADQFRASHRLDRAFRPHGLGRRTPSESVWPESENSRCHAGSRHLISYGRGRNNVTLDAAAKRLFCLLVIVPSLARAEVGEVHCAQQFGLSYLALMMMEDGRLVEKQAEKLGLSGLKTTWSKFGGVGPMNDALLSGRVDFSAGGVPSVATLWAKTKGTPLEVRGVGALNNMPVELITSDPEVKSIRDFGPKDKIAVPTVKMSNQALFLEMGAAKEFGEENYEKLDALTVTMPHPDALAAMLSHTGGIPAHFSSPPYQGQEKTKGKHHILTK